MTQQLLERQGVRAKSLVTTNPSRSKSRTPITKGKGAPLAFAVLGLLGLSLGIVVAPRFQPEVKVRAPQSSSTNSYKMDLMAGYVEGEPTVTGARSNQYQNPTWKTGDVRGLKPRPPVSSITPVSPVTPVRPIAPVTPAVPEIKAPINKAPERKAPIVPATTNPLDGFMGSMSNAMANGVGAIGSIGQSGAYLMGSVAGAGVKVSSAAMNVGGQVISNVGNVASSNMNNMAQNIGNYQPMQNQAPVPQLDGLGPVPPNSGGGGDGGNDGPSNNGSPGNNGGPNYGDSSPPSSMNSGGPGEDMAQASPGGEGPCGQRPPCSQPPSPCEQNTSTSFVKR